MVLLGRDPEPEVEALSKSGLDTPGTTGTGAWRKTWRSNLVGNHLRSERELSLVYLIENQCSTISTASATSDETARVEELVLTLETMALLRD
ncbi:hypothetical protein Tco_0814133 [Tanacetum coccineum]